MDEEGIAEAFLDDTAIADVASELLLLSFSSHNSLFSGPGTSLKGPPGTTSRGLSQGIRLIHKTPTFQTTNCSYYSILDPFRNRGGRCLDLFVPGLRGVVPGQWSRLSGRQERQ